MSIFIFRRSNPNFSPGENLIFLTKFTEIPVILKGVIFYD